MASFAGRPGLLSRPGWILGAVLLLAALLRLAGICWGLPDALHPGYSYHPDEVVLLFWAQSLAQGKLFAGQFIYGGTLYFNLLNALRWCAERLGGVSSFTATIMLGRYFAVACSLLTLVLVYRIGARLLGAAAGLLAAAFLALSPAHCFLAQNLRPDECGTLIATLLLWLGTLVLQSDVSGDRRLFALSGLALGVAVALRFPLAAFVVAPVLAYALRERAAGWKRNVVSLLRWRLPLLLVMAVPAYAIASPQSLMYFEALRQGLAMQKGYQTSAFPDAVGHGPGLYQYGWLMLRGALGTPLYCLALGGVILALVRREAWHWLLLAAFLAYFVPVTMVSWVVVRYTLPVLPVLVLLAAGLVVEFSRRGESWRIASAAAVSAAMAWTLLADLSFLRLETGPNVREVAAAWIQTHVPPQASILAIQQYRADPFETPALPESYNTGEFVLGVHQLQDLLAPGPDHDYLVLNSSIYDNMERLGNLDPQKDAYALQQVLDSGRYHLEVEITRSPRLLGIDFSDIFSSNDYRMINPGQRIYRYLPPPAPAAP